jgi:hypothetical protein
MEIRTKRGKLIGVFDENKELFCIKDRNKEMVIKIPSCGLRLQFTPGDGKYEEVYIPSKVDKPMMA